MRIGPFGPSEIGVILLTAVPWILGLAMAVTGLVLLYRLVRANERIADEHEAARRER